jgi:hypothetical protein
MLSLWNQEQDKDKDAGFCYFSSTLYWRLSRAMKQEKEINDIQIGKKDVKLYSQMAGPYI